MDFQTAAIIILIGVAAGLLSGLVGLGGAVIVIPALVLILGFSQQMAQGTTLFMMVFPVGALAAYQYFKAGNVDVRAAALMAIAFFVSGYFGAKLAPQLPQDVLRKLLAGLIILIGIKMFFQK